jgi:membrane protein implicated in regulation of membrane protease activity
VRANEGQCVSAFVTVGGFVLAALIAFKLSLLAFCIIFLILLAFVRPALADKAQSSDTAWGD